MVLTILTKNGTYCYNKEWYLPL